MQSVVCTMNGCIRAIDTPPINVYLIKDARKIIADPQTMA